MLLLLLLLALSSPSPPLSLPAAAKQKDPLRMLAIGFALRAAGGGRWAAVVAASGGVGGCEGRRHSAA